MYSRGRSVLADCDLGDRSFSKVEEGPRIEFYVCVIPPQRGHHGECPREHNPTSASGEELTQGMAVLWPTCSKIVSSQGQLDSSHF